MVNIDVDASGLLNILQGILDQSQCLQSQEVHLDEANGLDHMAVVLGHHHTFLGLAILHSSHGSYLGEVLGADNDAASVDTHLTVGVLKLLSIS